MERINGRAGRTLKHLRAVLDVGERGYAVAAANVDNGGLKILFQTYSKQRASFRAELDEEIRPQGAYSKALVGMLAAVHRGRINIFAALTIGDRNRELIVVREVLAGEEVAIRAYQTALNSHLPAGIGHTISRQYEMVKGVVDEVSHLGGRGGVWLVVRLHDSGANAARST